jgi:acyl carrier protein
MSSVEQRVKKVIFEQQAEVAEEDISNDSSLQEDLGLEDLDITEIVMNLEDEFDIEISDEDAANLTTVQEVIDLVIAAGVQDGPAQSVDEQLHRLGQLINEPLVRPRLREGLYDAITEELSKYRSDGLEAVSEDLLKNLSTLVQDYESMMVKYANQPPVFSAAQSGGQAEVLAALKAGFDINARDADGMTLLMLAASKGHAELVACLLDRGADMAATCEQENDFDAMIMACAAGHVEVARLLLDHGVDVNKRYAPGSSLGRIGNQTALSFAANRGRLDVCRLLVSRGADMEVVADSGYTALMWALVNGASQEAAELLLDLGANPDPKATPIPAYAGALTTPLIMAARNRLSRVARQLIDAGVELDAKDNSGWTALKHASLFGQDEIVRALIESGADFNIPDNEGWTPLIGAASRAAWTTMDLLINSGADVNHVADGGTTALGEVVARRLMRHTIVSLSRLAGRDLDPVQAEGYDMALVFAEKLLDAGADPDVVYHRDEGKKKLIDDAIEQGDEELRELLERFGAEPCEDLDDEDDEQDDESNEAGSDEEPTDLAGLLAKMQGALAEATSALGRLSGSSLADKPAGDRLIIAASHSNVEQVTEILESGVDVNHLDSDGDTALGLCVLKLCTEELEPQRIRDFFELIDLLLEHGAQVDVPGCRVAPLPMVARSGSLALTNAFLRAGANPNAVMTDMDHDAGKTALEVAREGGHDEVVAALLAAQG